ncbi:MAG: hypothetical protein QXF61_05620 [Nitrososphaeria archaeon]
MYRVIEFDGKRIEPVWRRLGYLVALVFFTKGRFFRSIEDLAGQFYEFLKKRNHEKWFYEEGRLNFYSKNPMKKNVAPYYVVLAQTLNLLDENLLWTPDAQTLYFLIDEFQTSCFGGAKHVDTDRSPLELNVKQRIFFLKKILEIDGNLIIPLVIELYQQEKSVFTPEKAARYFLDIIEKIAIRLSESVLFKDKQLSVVWLKNVEKWRRMLKGERLGKGQSTPELRVNVRLEFLLDLALLGRPVPPDTCYVASNETNIKYLPSKIYTHNLIAFSSIIFKGIDEFCFNFYENVSKIYEVPIKMPSKEVIYRYLFDTHDLIQDDVGRALKPTLFDLVCINSLVNEGFVIEESDVDKCLKYLADNYHGVYTTVDQWGREMFVHINDEIKKKLRTMNDHL